LIQSKVSGRSDSNYKCEIPNKKDLHVDANSCPDYYKDIYTSHILSPNKSSVGRNEFTEQTPFKFSSINMSGTPLPYPPHVNLNHLTLKRADPLSSHILIASTTTRFKNKCLTMVYYKPVN
jgi:hypothetical protein